MVKLTTDKDEDGFWRAILCPICNSKADCYSTTEEYGEYTCPKHGRMKGYKDSRVITKRDELLYNCKNYIAILNRGDESIWRVEVHEDIAYAFGLKHDDEKLKEVLSNLDKYIGLPLYEMSNPDSYGKKLYNYLIKKFKEVI